PRTEKVFLSATPALDLELNRQQHIYDIMRAFADRAFRRPATHDEVMRLLAIVLSAERDGEDAESALQLAFEAILVSPQFLFLQIKSVHEPESTGDLLSLTDFDLAARLSYFLWSSMPDEELFQLAAQGALRRRDNLSVQVRRMLIDPKSSALADNFSSQW